MRAKAGLQITGTRDAYRERKIRTKTCFQITGKGDVSPYRCDPDRKTDVSPYRFDPDRKVQGKEVAFKDRASDNR